MNQTDKIFDVTIIGGGPVGMFTAFYAGLRNMSVQIIESLPQLGGQLSALYPEKYIYDIAAFPKVKALDLIDQLDEQMLQFDPTITLEQTVLDIEKQTDRIIKITTNKEMHFTKSIIITAGIGAFQPRKLQLAHASAFEGENLHYFVKDMDRFRGKKVQVLGGGDSAVDWALMLEPIAKEVTIAHRRDAFRAHENSVQQLKNSSVRILTPYEVSELVGEEKIEKVILEKVKGEEKESIDVDEVIVNYGFKSELGPIKEWGIDIDKNRIVVNSRMETNIEGVYSAGDICTYDGKVKLIASGFGEGPTAVSNAKVYIDPKARVQPMHSTSVMGK